MNNPANEPWRILFPPPANAARCVAREFHLLRKRGEPLLLVPARKELVTAAMSLYPAQSFKAKLARSVAGFALRRGLNFGAQRIALPMDPQSAFVQFLGPPDSSGHFAMLMGNPRAMGRRLVVLVFDALGKPNKIVKVGVGEAASALIRREAEFIKTAGDQPTSAPRLEGEFAEGEIAALAFEFVPGGPPRFDDVGNLSPLLTRWLDARREVCFSELAVGQRMMAGARTDALTRLVLSEIGNARFHPALFHGDLTPWNVRVNSADGRWRVFDWERGESAGPPAWDWFHFVMQPLILVRKLSASALAAEATRLLQSPEFARYAAVAKIEAAAPVFFLAYLLYSRDVLKPTEGMEATEALLARLAEVWTRPAPDGSLALQRGGLAAFQKAN